MLIDIPEHVAEKATGLGEPLAHFEASRAQMLLCLILSGPIILLGAGAIVGAIVLMLGGGPKFGPLVSFKMCVGGIGWGVFLILMGIGMVVRWRSLRNTGVFVFAEGFVQHDRATAEAVRWESIREVRRGKPPGQEQLNQSQLTMVTPARLALTDDAGREWVFTETLSGLKEFREFVEERTLPHLLPGALDQILDGRTLMFGDIGALEQGLGYPGQPFLPWDRVAGAGVEKEKVVIRSAHMKKPYCRVAMFEVPNVHLLLAIVDQFRRG